MGTVNQRGSSTYTFLGLAIIVVVVIATLSLFMRGDFMQKGPHPDMVAAEQAMAKHQWKQAIAKYDKSLKANPGNAEAYIGRSRAYVQLGDMNQALKDAVTAVEKKPSLALAYGQRGIVLKLQQKPDEAMKDFAAAVRLDPRYAWAYAQRADLFSRKNEQEKALADVNKAVASDPKFVSALRLRAWVLNRMGKCKEASEDFQKVEQLSPEDAWTLQDKAWFLMTCPDEQVQNPTKAMELAQKALKVASAQDGLIYETLAEAYFKQGDPLKAVEVQKKAIEMGSKKCPDGSCIKEMKDRLQKYEMTARQEVRTGYEILPFDSAK
ncbi:MAG: tetratricopeptide repeat protein [Desulfomonile tiedjei]|nr:tetratricopeptide repeat protein [Desulfomonile tiedjei]